MGPLQNGDYGNTYEQQGTTSVPSGSLGSGSPYNKFSFGSVGSALVGHGLNFLTNLGTAAIQRRWNQQDAKIAYQRQLAFWDKQNRYNSPANQRRLLEAAGINPNAQMGALSSGAAQSLSPVNQSQPANIQSSPLDASLGVMQSIASLNDATADMQAAATQQTMASIDNLLAVTQGQYLDNAQQIMFLESLPQRIELELENIASENRLNWSQASLQDKEDAFLGLTLAMRVVGVDLQNQYVMSQIKEIALNLDLEPKRVQALLKQAEAAMVSANASAKDAQNRSNSQYWYQLANQLHESAMSSKYQRTEYLPASIEQQWFNIGLNGGTSLLGSWIEYHGQQQHNTSYNRGRRAARMRIRY